jgi:hypothetical protein
MMRLDWRNFEERARDHFEDRFGVELSETRLQIGPNQYHRFDLVSPDEDILIECKSFTWTAGENFPQAKISTANETMLFLSRVEADRKLLVMQDDFSPDGRSLVKTYANRYGGLTDDIEVWQYLPRQADADTVTQIIGANVDGFSEDNSSPETHAAEDAPQFDSPNTEHRQDETDRGSAGSTLDFDGLDYEFVRVGMPSFERDSDGEVEVKRPQDRYSNADHRALHPHGDGPYCQFDLDVRPYEEAEGVFLITVDGEPKYIGRSSNIGKYLYDISNVTPSACYEGGQQTVCRLNTKLFKAAREGRELAVWATESEHPGRIKQGIRNRFALPWNSL